MSLTFREVRALADARRQARTDDLGLRRMAEIFVGNFMGQNAAQLIIAGLVQ